MNKKLKILSLYVVVIIFFHTACDIQGQWFFELPQSKGFQESEFMNSMTEVEKQVIEGIYKVTEGNELAGDTLVLKSTRDKISIFGLRDGFYSVLDTAKDSSRVTLSGHWRCALNKKNGNISLETNYNFFIRGSDIYSEEKLISGEYEYDGKTKEIKLKFVESFSESIVNDSFYIAAHRGGGRTADQLPYSENSIEMINYSEYLGSNGIEIDVVMTKDKVPVIYHDLDLNIRLVQKGPLLGYVRDYNFEQLSSFVKLIHGEKIPSLEETLDFVINKTQIKLALLDIKEGESFDYVVPLMRKYMQLAIDKGREIDLLVSIQTNEVYDSYNSNESFKDIPVCCTMEAEKVNSINAKIWNYRWTQGIKAEEIIQMHNSYRKCMVWTLDVPEFIDLYLSHGNNDPIKRLDGILTNYPTILAYYHYVRRN